MKKLEFDTPKGRGFLDAALMEITKGNSGDILVITYGGEATPDDALNFVMNILKAVESYPEYIRNRIPKMSIVYTREGVEWIEPKK